ncbi:MAG: DUF6030 family protein [Pseudomonadota bacterium]|nr:DUF6030 family protein [Pseudomonadota bacterium]
MTQTDWEGRTDSVSSDIFSGFGEWAEKVTRNLPGVEFLRLALVCGVAIGAYSLFETNFADAGIEPLSKADFAQLTHSANDLAVKGDRPKATANFAERWMVPASFSPAAGPKETGADPSLALPAAALCKALGGDRASEWKPSPLFPGESECLSRASEDGYSIAQVARGPAARRVDLVRLTLDVSETADREEGAKALSERFATAVKGLGLGSEDELQTRVSALESFDADLGPFEVSLYVDIADPDRFHLVLDREQNPFMMSAVQQ